MANASTASQAEGSWGNVADGTTFTRRCRPGLVLFGKDQALAALTELFNEVKNKNTHVIVERIVADIDAIVKQVRFDGWQTTKQGEREVQQALRRSLLKYRLHTDQELFEKAYGYIREYY